MYPDSHVTVELELTPVWWRRLTQRLSPKDDYEKVRALHTEVTTLALTLPMATMVKTERTKLIVRVSVPRNSSLAALCSLAGEVLDQMHKLNISCLDVPKVSEL